MHHEICVPGRKIKKLIRSGAGVERGKKRLKKKDKTQKEEYYFLMMFLIHFPELSAQLYL